MHIQKCTHTAMLRIAEQTLCLMLQLDEYINKQIWTDVTLFDSSDKKSATVPWQWSHARGRNRVLSAPCGWADRYSTSAPRACRVAFKPGWTRPPVLSLLSPVSTLCSMFNYNWQVQKWFPLGEYLAYAKSANITFIKALDTYMCCHFVWHSKRSVLTWLLFFALWLVLLNPASWGLYRISRVNKS